VLETANRALFTGLAAIAVVMLLAIAVGTWSPAEAALLLTRSAHVFMAMVWVGLIWFVNLIQMAAVDAASEPDRKSLMTQIAPRVSRHIGIAANATFLTGALLIVALGYLTQRPLTGSLWLWAGVLGATAMLGFVHAKIAPAMRTLLDTSITDPAVKGAARTTLRTFARINLVLAVPVTVAMLAGAHG